MGYGEELARVTVGCTTYVVHEPFCSKGLYDIHAENGGGSFRFFGSFQDPKYLDEENLAEYIRQCLKLRTGIPE